MAVLSIADVRTHGTRHSARYRVATDSLREEFGIPFALFDASGTTAVSVPGDFPSELNERGCPQLVGRVASSERVEVEQGPDDWQLLGVPVWRGGKVALVAIGALRRWIEPPTGLDAEAVQSGAGESAVSVSAAASSARCLGRWAQAVADRQRLEDRMLDRSRHFEAVEGQLEVSTKLLDVLDRLAARMRISDRPEKFQKLAMAALAETISVECLAWVPADPQDAAATTGHPPIDPEQLRRLVLAATSHRGTSASRSYIENQVDQTPWGQSFGPVRSIAVITTGEDRLAGWLVALNKAGDMGFCPNDTALLRPVASLLSVQRKNVNVYTDLKELLFGVVRALTSAIDAKDPYTRGHSERVARIAVCLGRRLKLGTDELSNLYLAGLLHDVGKIGVDDSVLKKPDALTDPEYRHVMSHVEIGLGILRELKRLRHVLPGVRFHHERYDGRGYPDKLQGENIPLIGRILAVADAFDAMSSDRSYRPRRSQQDVQDILRGGAGQQWDPKVVEAAVACWGELTAIQQRGLGESLRIAVDDALHQEYPTNGSSGRSLERVNRPAGG